MKRPLIKLARRTALALAIAIVGLLVIWTLLPRVELYPEGYASSRVLRDREGKVLHLTLTPDEKYRLWTPLDKMGDEVVEATLMLEDRHFRLHPGVNPFSMLRAAWGAATATPRGGGSTITMQQVRLRFGLNTRTWWGKTVQMCRAMQMERHYTKDEILEAYLNMAPYGGNVEGVGAASLLWCGKYSSELNLRESVALAVLPQSPTRRRPRSEGENKSLSIAQYRLIQRVQEERGLPADPLDAEYTLRPEGSLPREVPHLARRLFQSSPAGKEVVSTIDRQKQHTLERAVADYLSRRSEMGLRNACAMLIHAPTREVLAYVGSAGFLDEGILGQVDGVTARRSPGSALKPFVYALALQQGLVQPRSLLRDSKTAFGGYDPENFDRQFAGPIAVEDALYHSRNIPAVWLSQKLQGEGLYGFLKTAGVALPEPSSHYGLSLPLGGGEVSMEELGALYCLLAHDGVPRALRYQIEEEPVDAPDEVLLTPEARFLTREMLRAREGEPLFDDGEVSWKTGTSHGFRDAWAAGIRGDYVLLVWIGNFDGRANPSLIARDSAAPMLFEAFRKLRLPSSRAVAPAGVEPVELCAVSGQLPAPCCQHRRHGWFIPGVSPIAPCSIHREVFLDGGTGLRLAADDGRPGVKREVMEFWPPDMLELFRQAGLPRREPPALEPAARAMVVSSGLDAPRISSPQEALVYTLRASEPERQSIPLRVDAAPGVRKVYWFAGKQFLGATAPVQPLMWSATAGSWKLQVLDDHGRSASCEIQVQMVE